ncbi:uncharacterized protein TNCV_119861 [Trichonephila clavipes]|nr:uncharacterized protein TNCV_119861 [Trichonephila clavipes]
MQCGKNSECHESIHSVIWKNCPKETFVSKKRLEMGVISAIGGYNFGCFNSLAIEHNELSSVSVDILHKRDKRRLAQSEKNNSSDWRKKRIINKLAKSSKITKNIKKEGETYGAGLAGYDTRWSLWSAFILVDIAAAGWALINSNACQSLSASARLTL